MKRRTKAEAVGDVFIYLLLGLLAIITVYPFLHVLALSFNEALDSVRGGIGIWPRKFTLNNYQVVFSYPNLLVAFKNSMLRTLLGTSLNVVLSAMMAFTLSRQDFIARRLYTTLFVITMYVGGGLIPSYLLIKSLNLMNTFAVYIVPSLVWTFCIIVLRSYMESLPYSLQESAMIDGANDLFVFFRIVFPLCAPCLATVGLFYAVAHWNSWFDAYLYNSGNKNLTTLQFELQKIITSISGQASNRQNNALLVQTAREGAPTPQSIQMAITVVVVTPIILVYPFLQRYFVKGMTLGSVKG